MPSKGNAAKQPAFRQKKAPKTNKEKKMVLKKIKKNKRTARKGIQREEAAAKRADALPIPEEKEEMVIELTKTGIRYVPKTQTKEKKHKKFGVVGRHGGRGKTSRRSF